MDVDEILASEATEIAKEKEIDRIFNVLRLDAYSVLDLQPGCTDQQIQKQFRKKSLLIHPDKTKDKRSPDAFDLLKTAHETLLKEDDRKYLDQLYADARRMLITRPTEPEPSEEDSKLDPKLDAKFLLEWRGKVSEILIDTELRRRKLRQVKMEQEGRLQQHAEDKRQEKLKKKVSEKLWQDSQDKRIDGWRKHLNHRKKRRPDKNVLG